MDIAVVDADLGLSTTAAAFGREFPERFFSVGVAEQNMVGTAAGLAAAAYRPVPMEFVGMEGQFSESGRWDELLRHFGLTAEGIAQAVRRALLRKKG
ncbi:MAG: hypothetical protein ACE5IZ_00560 [Dehalococcoidia bacterium]